MKRLLFISALLGILFQLGLKSMVIADYLLNKDFIASNLCVKKDISNNDCQGQCHLKKQLKEADQQDNKTMVKTILGAVDVSFKEDAPELSLKVFLTETELFYSEQQQHTFSFAAVIYHPPLA